MPPPQETTGSSSLSDSEQREKRRQKFLEYPQIPFEEFGDIYTPEQIAADREELEKIKEKVYNRTETSMTTDGKSASEIEAAIAGAKIRKKQSKQEEALFAKQIEQWGWLGFAETARTGEYDDWLNHTDLVAQWETDDPNNEHLHLSIDLTVAAEEMVTDVLRKKQSKIDKEIQTGTLTTVKYADPDVVEQHPLKNIPSVIVGTTHEELARIKALAQKNAEAQKGNAEARQRLTNEHLQLQFLEQIENQLTKQVVLLVSYRLTEAARRVGGVSNMEPTAQYFTTYLVTEIIQKKSNGIVQEKLKSFKVRAFLEAMLEKESALRPALKLRKEDTFFSSLKKYKLLLDKIVETRAEKKKPSNIIVGGVRNEVHNALADLSTSAALGVWGPFMSQIPPELPEAPHHV